MKQLIIFCSLILLVHCVELNDTIKSTTSDVIVESEPQPLLDISKIKNSTKDAADRIIKLITSSKEPELVTTEKPLEYTTHPLFNSFYSNYNTQPFSIFGLHKTPEKPVIKSNGERLCTCRTEYSFPSFSSSFVPSSSEYDFNSQNNPTFEVVLPSKDYSFPNSVESPLIEREIINQYPPLDLKDLWKFEDSNIRSNDKV